MGYSKCMSQPGKSVLAGTSRGTRLLVLAASVMVAVLVVWIVLARIRPGSTAFQEPPGLTAAQENEIIRSYMLP